MALYCGHAYSDYSNPTAVFSYQYEFLQFLRSAILYLKDMCTVLYIPFYFSSWLPDLIIMPINTTVL